VLYEILDGEPSGIGEDGGSDGGSNGLPIAEGSTIRLRLASPQPVMLGRGGSGPGVRLSLELARPSAVEVAVYDACGRMIDRIAGGPGRRVWSVGAHSLLWEGSGMDCRGVAPGVYYVSACARSRGPVVRRATTRIVVLR
jgi:hypothetical protein